MKEVPILFEMKYAPVIFLGIQGGFKTVPPFPLYNTLMSFGPFPSGTTVTRQSIEKAGYNIPEIEILWEQHAWESFCANVMKK